MPEAFANGTRQGRRVVIQGLGGGRRLGCWAGGARLLLPLTVAALAFCVRPVAVLHLALLRLQRRNAGGEERVDEARQLLDPFPVAPLVDQVEEMREQSRSRSRARQPALQGAAGDAEESGSLISGSSQGVRSSTRGGMRA